MENIKLVIDNSLKFISEQNISAYETKVKEYSSLHYVEAGESMLSISQKYGLKLRSLYDLDDMEYDEKPHVGQKLYLR